jgi:hypothetical protein
MIAYSLGYATARNEWLDRALTWPTRSVAASVLVIHLIIQCIFTIFVHADALIRSEGKRKVLVPIGFSALILLFGAIGPASSIFSDDGEGELIYRLFMSFYALFFPAYVWLCMIPTRDGHSGIDGPRGRRKAAIWLVSVLIAAPMFWMGFIERVEWWLAPGLGVVLLARLILPRRPVLGLPSAASSPAAPSP